MSGSLRSDVKVGMTADEVLALPGRSAAHAVGGPKVVGKDGHGFVTKWFYPDCTVTLHRRDGAYRVRGVKNAVPADD